MSEPNFLITQRFLLLASVMVFFMFPGISSRMWHTVTRLWSMRKSHMIVKRRPVTEDKLKKYWEIDPKKFR